MARRIIGWRRVRPRRSLSGLGLRILYNPEAPPKADGNGNGTVYTMPWFPPTTWSCAPGFAPGTKPGSCIQFPIPGGTVGVVVTQSPTPTATANGGAIVPAGTVDRAKQWLQEKSLVSEYENWKVLAAGAGLLWLVKK